jgi:Tol biopolymer transport system component
MKGNILSQLTNEAGYDAEATVSPKGDKIVFTSMRTGDLELFTMNIDGTDVKQITTELGYDGGAFFSPDGTKLVWRASRPQTPEAIQEYQDLLKEGLVKPTDMELYVANVDGTDIRKITSLGTCTVP